MSNFYLPLAAFVLAVGFAGPRLAASDPSDTHPDLHLIPWPKSLKQGTGHAPLTAESRIVIADEELKPLAEVLADEIATLTGLKLKVTADPARAGDIVLKINQAIRAEEQILVLRNREPVRTTDGAPHRRHRRAGARGGLRLPRRRGRHFHHSSAFEQNR